MSRGALAVALIGSGCLYAAIQHTLVDRGWQVRHLDADDLDGNVGSRLDETVAQFGAMLSVSDGRPLDLHGWANRASLRWSIPWLRIFVEPGKALVGPWRVPGERGCVTCADNRRSQARERVSEHKQITTRFARRLANPVESWLTAASMTVLAELAGAELESIVADSQPMTLRAMYFLRLIDLRGEVHHFLPDPLCADCGTLPADSPEAATITMVPRPKYSPSSYRLRRLSERSAELHHAYVDQEIGLVRDVRRDEHSMFPNASARVGLRGQPGTEIGFGRTLNYQGSELTAITESLERYAGTTPGGRRTVVRGSHREVADDALDPVTLGLHADWQYDLPNFRFQRYHEDLVCNWVWGYSFRRQAPILVPESYAYYGHLHRPGRDRPFVYEISNGCSLGGCIEEAILHGLLEIAERDAFLMTWYARMSRPRIDPDSARDRSIPLMVDRIEETSGYRAHAFDITTELDVPAFWVMAVDELGGNRPRAHIAAGSAMDPERALRNALLELAPLLARPAEAYRTARQRALTMLDDPHEVRNMDDHAILYSTPEAFGRLSFIYDSHRLLSFQDAFEKSALSEAQPDLTVDLDRVLARCLGAGLDVVVVDQTTPEQAVCDLHCVKVIVPGALPITFGHRHQRTTGLERLTRVPWELGYAPRPLNTGDLNLDPHPFP